MTGGAEGAVLDTTALLHWPLERLAGGVCCPTQLDELERLSPARRMLVEAAAETKTVASPDRSRRLEERWRT